MRKIEPSSTNAVIYCRVSSQKQMREGNGINSQEVSCRNYAQEKGLQVLAVFQEKGVSGANDPSDRPALQTMLDFLKTNAPVTVIVDDLSRWSRDQYFHFHLKRIIVKMGCQLASVKQHLSNDPSNIILESMYAGIAEHDRIQNTARVLDRMSARLQSGELPWARIPYGYKRDERKQILPDPVHAPFAKLILEGFASGKFSTQQEIVDYLRKSADFKAVRRIKPTLDWVKKILTRPYYAGYVSYEKWGVEPLRGNHEALIDLSTFNRIKSRLSKRPRHRIYQTIREDFPLRGFLLCDECIKPLTGSDCGGRSKKYPYYYCKTQGCSLKSQTIARQKMHDEFVDLLHQISPPPQISLAITAILQDLYRDQKAFVQRTKAADVREIAECRERQAKLVDAIIKEEDPVVEQGLRDRLRETRNQIAAGEERLDAVSNNTPTLPAVVDKAIGFLATPAVQWTDGSLSQKLLVLNLTFSEGLRVRPGKKFKTGGFSPAFNALRQAAIAEVGNGGA